MFPSMNASIQRSIFNWANTLSFPPAGASAPGPGEETRTPGSSIHERAIVKRDTFRVQVAGFVQVVPTVSLTWIVIHAVVPREKRFNVKLHVPFHWFGTLSDAEWCSALVGATAYSLDPLVGSIRRQPLMYRYFSTLLWKTVSLAETLPTCHYDGSYIDRLWRSGKSDGTVVVPGQAYPMRSPRWAFEVTEYNNDPSALRVDFQAPRPDHFSCVVIVSLGSIAPRHWPSTSTRRRLVINRIKAYIRALDAGFIAGQYAH